MCLNTWEVGECLLTLKTLINDISIYKVLHNLDSRTRSRIILTDDGHTLVRLRWYHKRKLSNGKFLVFSACLSNSFSFMDYFMSLQMILTYVRFAAQITFERSFACVFTFMHLEIFIISVFTPAHVTLVRTLACVNQRMSLQIESMDEQFPAHITLEVSVVCVRSFVFPQVAGGHEAFIAHAAMVRTVRRMNTRNM